MPKKDTTNDFYEEVRDTFFKLAETRELGVLKYTKEFCLAKVAKKHHRSPRTVENIIFNRA